MDRTLHPQDVALRWLDEGRRVVAATLVETLGSAPLDPGAEMLVDDDGRIEGSVTGGCVLGALGGGGAGGLGGGPPRGERKSTRLNSSCTNIPHAGFSF